MISMILGVRSLMGGDLQFVWEAEEWCVCSSFHCRFGGLAAEMGHREGEKGRAGWGTLVIVVKL